MRKEEQREIVDSDEETDNPDETTIVDKAVEWTTDNYSGDLIELLQSKKSPHYCSRRIPSKKRKNKKK